MGLRNNKGELLPKTVSFDPEFQIQWGFEDDSELRFSYFLVEIYIVGPHLNRSQNFKTNSFSYSLLFLFLCNHEPRFSCCTIYSILFYPKTLEGRRDTTDEFATITSQPVLSSAALPELTKPIPVHSLILSSLLFFCLPLLFSLSLCPL